MMRILTSLCKLIVRIVGKALGIPRDANTLMIVLLVIAAALGVLLVLAVGPYLTDGGLLLLAGAGVAVLLALRTHRR